MTFRPLRSRPCRHSRLRDAFLIVCLLFAAVATKAKGEYTFTSIADSTGPLGDFGFAPPSLSATGTVAFRGTLDNGNRGVFSGNGGTLTTIATNPLPVFGYPTINAAGTVAFDAADQRGGGIYAGNGGPLVTIADTAGPLRGFAGGYSVSINSAGTVAFWALPDSGPAGIFAAAGGNTTPIFVNSPALNTDSSFTMNDAGTLAIRRSNGVGIFTVSDGLITTIADGTGLLNYFGRAPSINEAGTVAFNAGVEGVDGSVFGIYAGNGGPLTTIADLSGPFSYLGDFYDNRPSINDAGAVAFVAGLDAGGGGLYIGNGASTSEVIGSGDSLFGSTITAATISPTSLNDAGQVAFYYELANGITGIAVATPVPEPTASLLLILSLGMGLARRGTQKR